MASGSVGRLNVLVGASIGGLRSGLKGGVKLVAGFAASVKGTLGGIGGLLAGVGAVVGLKTAAESMDATAKAADRLGIGIEAFVGLQHAANLSNVDVAALNLSLTKMEDNLATAATKGGPVEKALNDIGLRSKDLVNLKPDEAFGKIADGIMSIGNPSQRTAAAIDIFGKSGAQLLPLLKEGSDGFAKFREEAKRLGLSFSEVDAAKIDAADDAVTRLKASFKGAFQQLVIGLSPAIAGFGESGSGAFASVARKVGEFVSTGIKEIGFFFGTMDIRWQLFKVNSALAWDTVRASAIASFDAMIAGGAAFANNIVPAFQNIKITAIATWEAIKAGFIALKDNFSGVFQDMGATVLAFASGTVAAVKAAFNLENPLTAFKAAFDKTFSESSSGAFATVGAATTKAFEDSIKAQGGLKNLESIGGAMGDAFQKGFQANLDPSLDAEKKNLEGELADIRKTFDNMGKGPVTAKAGVKGGVGEFAGTKGVGMGVSSQLAGAAQIGTTEAASQITASMTAFNKKDDQIEKNTQRTADGIDRMNTKLDDLEGPDFDMIPAF